MMLMVAYAASIGGIGTPVGSPPNLIGIGLIRRTAHVDITFFRWMALMVPMLIVMAAALFVLLYALHPERRTTAGSVNDATGAGLTDYIAAERQRLGGWTAGQVNTLLAFAVAIALWVLPGVLALPGFGPENYAKIAPLVTALPNDETVNTCTASGLVLDATANDPQGNVAYRNQDLKKLREKGCFPIKADFIAGIIDSTAKAAAQSHVSDQSSWFRLRTNIRIGTAEFVLYSVLLREKNSNHVRTMQRSFGSE
jgi:hypothetical protein